MPKLPKIKDTPITRTRHRKSNPKIRCCWVCGKPGACYGFTSALRMLGYNTTGTVAHAHVHCIARLQREEVRKSPAYFSPKELKGD
jgi:hypothetical protein